MEAYVPTHSPVPNVQLVPGSTMMQKTYTVNADGTPNNATVLATEYNAASNSFVPVTATHQMTKTDTALDVLAQPRLSLGNLSEFAAQESKAARETPVYNTNRVTVESHSTVAKAMAKNNWQGKMARILESQNAHIFLMVITFLDLIVTIIEMSVELLTGSNCPEYEGENVVAEVCHIISTVCLLLMCFDLFLRLITFGPMYFLGSCLHLFDAVVRFKKKTNK
jgi:hypothetical protein